MSSLSNERRLITSAVAELINQDESCLTKGVTFNELARAATAKTGKLTRKQLESVIHREISSGALVRLPSGNLRVRQVDHDDSSDSMKFDYGDNISKIASSHSSGGSSPHRARGRPRKRPGDPASSGTARGAAVRVGVRRKMAKKVFDPSENNVPSKRKRGRPVGSLNKVKRIGSKPNGTRSEGSGESLDLEERDDASNASEDMDPASGGVCSVCLVQKSRGSDRLIECRDCSNKAHASCIQSGSGMLKLQPDNGWQCPHCKTCVVCCETNDAGMLTVCSVCSDAYHALCHSPTISQEMTAWDQWECINCQKISLPVQQPIPVELQKPPRAEPFMKPHERVLSASQLEGVCEDPAIPDIRDWSSGDVYDYFLEHLPEVAHVFKQQEMDGPALSMARRSDIVRGLGLLLGPAMRLYRIVVKLQSRRDDFTMCWG